VHKFVLVWILIADEMSDGPATANFSAIFLKFLLSIYGFTVILLDLGRFSSFLILYTVGRTPWTGDQHVTRPLPTHRTTQTQN
jgi:hypothetical protein